MDLTHMIDRFLDERLEGRRMSLRQATRYRFRLVGDSSLPFVHIGFVRFLKASGVEKPTLKHINDHYVGRYWEFLIQHHGGLQATWAMRALRIFWKWCVMNEYIKDRPMPPDLAGVEAANLYRVRTSIEER